MKTPRPDMLPSPANNQCRIHDIERAVCDRFHLTTDQMRGKTRLRKIARPRQMAMYLARKLTGASMPAIGNHFHRDHTTVLHACQKIAAMQETHPKIVGYLAEIEHKLSRINNAEQAGAA